MSLQVWLPLNGNLNNQGLSEVTSAGGTVNDAGILGKCYACSSSSYIAINNPVTNKYHFSFSFWMKIPTTLSSVGAWNTMFLFRALNKSGDSTETSEGISWTDYNNIKIYDEANHQNIWMAPGNQFNYDKWCHYTITHTGNDSSTTIKVYTDGILRGTFNNSHRLVLRSGDILLGSGINPSYGPIYFNDFRLYDHCLSAKEVKEISKGLICHYKLDNKGFGNPNLLITQNPSEFSRQGNIYTSTEVDSRTNDPLYLQYFTGSTYVSTFYSQDVSVTPCDVKTTFTVPESITGVRVKFNGISNDIDLFSASQAPVTAGETYTFSCRVLSSKSEIVGGVQVENPKLEKGSVATPWCPHTSDSLYTSLGLDSTTEEDCSGLGNNGVIKNQSAISIEKDSPRYEVSTVFNGAPFIIGQNLNGAKSTDALSLCAWINPSQVSEGNIISSYEGGGAGLHISSGNIYFQIYSNGYTGVSGGSVSANTWYYVVGTYDNSKLRIYINGKLKGEVAKTGNITYHSGTPWSVAVNPSGTGDGGEHFYGKLSDVRIYSTALSASDVKELYGTSASVDKSGNMYAYEFKEE